MRDLDQTDISFSEAISTISEYGMFILAKLMDHGTRKREKCQIPTLKLKKNQEPRRVHSCRNERFPHMVSCTVVNVKD